MGIGLDSYKFGRKNNWRRQVWNEAVTRLKASGKQISECKVLYLPGAENIDGKVAIEKGFKPWNLYAVENDKERIISLRDKKINVIDGDFNEILWNWPNNTRLDFIFADFCGGITKTSWMFMNTIMGMEGMSEKCVIVINLLRGRDKEYRKSFMEILKEDGKHRGWQWFHIFYLNNIRSCTQMNEIIQGRKLSEEEKRLIGGCYFKAMNDVWIPKTFSYNSLRGNVTLVMDSIIFNWGSLMTPFCIKEKDYDKTREVSYVRKIAAAKAIHTMWKNSGSFTGYC